MTTEATELSITLAGTDPDGNSVRVVTRARITEPAPPPVPEPPAEPEPVPEPESIAESEPLTEPEPPPEPRMPEPAMVAAPQQTAEVQPLAQPVQIPGLGNATGHQTTETASKAKPVMASQVTTSQTLFRRTGGFR